MSDDMYKVAIIIQPRKDNVKLKGKKTIVLYNTEPFNIDRLYSIILGALEKEL